VWTPEVEKLAEVGRNGSQSVQIITCQGDSASQTVASAICILLNQDASYIMSKYLPTNGSFTALSPEGFGELTI